MAQSSVTKTRIDLPTWWGNRQDLARLLSLVQNLHQDASAELQSQILISRQEAREVDAERVESLASAIASFISKNGGDPGPFAEPEKLREEVRMLGSLGEPDYKLVRAVEELKLEMAISLKTWEERRTGVPETLLDGVDEQEIKSIELSFGQTYSGGAALRLVLGENGIRTTISGPVGWVSSASGQLDVELKRQSSWLGHVSHPGVQSGLSGILVGLAIWIALPNVSPGAWVAVILGFVFVAIVLPAFLVKLVPRFELLKDGKPKVGMKIRWVAGILGTVILGLAVNGLSKVMGL